MPIVEIPDVGDVEFSDEMSAGDIDTAIRTQILPQVERQKMRNFLLREQERTQAEGISLDQPTPLQATAQALMKPLVDVPRALGASPLLALAEGAGIAPKGTTDAVAGVVEGAVESMTSPVGIATLPIGAAGAVGPALRGAAGLALGAAAVHQTGAGVERIAKGLGDSNGAEVAGGIAEVALGSAMGVGGIGLAVAPRTTLAAARATAQTAPKPPKIAEIAPKVAETSPKVETTLPETLEATSPEMGIVPPVIQKLQEIAKANEILDSGQVSVAVAEKDVMPGRDIWTSPEFEFRKHPVAAPLVTKAIEADMKYRYQTDLDRQRFDVLKENLSPTDQFAITSALKAAEKGDGSPLEALPENQRAVAGEIRTYFDEMRNAVRAAKQTEIVEALDGPRQNAVRQILDGVPEAEAFKANRLKAGGQSVVRAALAEIKDVNKWGLDDYVTHIERGTWRVMDEAGGTVAIGETRVKAALKAGEYLREHPEAKNLTLTDEFNPGVEFPTQLSRGQYWRMVSRLSERTELDAAAIQELIHQQGHSIVAVKPTRKYAGPMQERRDVLKGEENIFDALPLYSHVMRKKLALDPVLADARGTIPKLPKNMGKQIETLLSDLKGRKTIGDQIADHILSPFGGKPFALSRGVDVTRKVVSWLKLGYRPVAAAVNRVGGMQHIWTKVGIPFYREGAAWIKTPEGKAALARNEPYLGIGASFAAESGRVTGKTPLAHPLGMFQAMEQLNRPEAFGAFYKLGEASGLSGAPLEAYARQQVRFSQFVYSIGSLPAMMRGPVGRLVFQFKPYLVKELEFISSLRGAEIGRYMAGFLAVGGPRAAFYTLMSVPILGAFGVWDKLEDWMNREYPRTSRGVGGALGVDVSPAVAFQFPRSVPELFGPFFSDLYKLWNDVARPVIEGEDRDGGDVGKWAVSLAPMALYLYELLKSSMSESGWVVDERGRPEFKPEGGEKMAMAMGAKPLRKSIEEVEARFLRTTEDIQQRNRSRLIDEYLAAMEKEDGDALDTLGAEMESHGITVDMVRNAAKQRGMSARERLFKSLTKDRRAAEIERFSDDTP